MASTGAKNGTSMRGPLTLSVDQSVQLTVTKSPKNKQKIGQIEQAPYEERLKQAREKLLQDAPKPQQASPVTNQEPKVSPKSEDIASYDARLQLMRKKLLRDHPKTQRDDTIATHQEYKNKSSNLKPSSSLVLNAKDLQNTPMCLTHNHQSSNKLEDTQEDHSSLKNYDKKRAIFEHHKKGISTLNDHQPDNTDQDNDFLSEDISPQKRNNAKSIKRVSGRGLPFSPKTHIRVTFTPHKLPHGISGVAGEDATENTGWLQKDAMEEYLRLEAQAREYETKKDAIYRSVKHDA